ncbi:hypothetical protein BB561_002873 [Smittium simulii]|uniref:glycerophosphodiester phosphodiesterase n=1 Tax=Smittium simulii TaxID=133385 RepID=A0A2T9YNW9_9FUNG|nr:hypothetical protein BB561_002873 [Smittium simulii]
MYLNISRVLLFSLTASITSAKQWGTLNKQPVRLVAHRGEKAFIPEHSAGSYHMSALESADYIEPDLVLSKDKVPVIIHNEWLSDTTNIADHPEFADRKKDYFFKGKYATINRTDWFVWDFTFAELKTLKLVQTKAYPYRPQYFNNDFTLLSFEEYLDHIENLSKILDRDFGVIPELKSPEIFNSIYPSTNGREFEDIVLGIMNARNFNVNQPPPFAPVRNNNLLESVLNINNKRDSKDKDYYKIAAIQSFDPETCQYLASKTKIPIVSLDEYTPSMYTPKGLDKIATYSKIFSPWKDVFLAGPKAYLDYNNITYDSAEIDKLGGFLEAKDIVPEAHKRGIEVSPYTFYDSRQDNAYICSIKNDTSFVGCPKNKKEEFFYFFDLGVDYMFVENINL